MFRILTRKVILDCTIVFYGFHDIGINFKSNKEEARLKYAACKVNSVSGIIYNVKPLDKTRMTAG